MKKSIIYLFGLLTVFFLGTFLVLSGTISNSSSSSDDEYTITKGEKTILVVLVVVKKEKKNVMKVNVVRVEKRTKVAKKNLQKKLKSKIKITQV